MKKTSVLLFMAIVLGMAMDYAQASGVTYKNEDGDYVKFGGRIQLQYHSTSPEDGDDTDELRFRRFRPYIEGSVHEDWKGKFQWDMGKGGIELKDAYFQYKGLDAMTVAFGNMSSPFSRELLTSSKKQGLVERTFVGDHNYGTPDRQAGIHLAGGVGDDDMIQWGFMVAKAAQDPSNSKLDFETAVSLEAGDDWSEGFMTAGRVEFFPMGAFKPEQGDFKGDVKAAFAIGAFSWANDDDNLDSEREDDVDTVTGIEVSAALRGGGLSVDAEYNTFSSELVDAGITDGIYEDSETTLENYAIEAGYMVVPSKVEAVVGYQAQDADGYAETWTRTSVGLNYYVQKHDIKYQATYRMGENKDGKDGNDVDEIFVQAQYVF